VTDPAALVDTVRFVPVGDRALLVEFASEISDAASGAVLALDRALAAAGVPGVDEVVPAMVNALVLFDPVVTDHEALGAEITWLLATARSALPDPQIRRVQVCYDETFGHDLPAVAVACDMSVDAVIDAHLAGDYRVLMYGFAPGYAYLGGVAPSIQVPRKPAAIRGIPAGRVIIAGPQCIVTTFEMPAGWSVIGSSPTPVLDPAADHPFLFDVGDRVVFERIDLAAHAQLAKTQRVTSGPGVDVTRADDGSGS
jgi:inhibitor of KinA